MTMQKQKREATTGEQWRKTREQGVEVQLPSGNVARLRNVRIAKLLMGGLISDTLTPIVHEMLRGEDGEKKLAKMSTQDVLAASVALKEAMCREAFAFPRIVDEPTLFDEIGLDDVAEEDQEFVMALLYSSAERLAARFPPGSPSDVPTVGEGEALSPTSE
jgi:hypothetical protein